MMTPAFPFVNVFIGSVYFWYAEVLSSLSFHLNIFDFVYVPTKMTSKGMK